MSKHVLAAAVISACLCTQAEAAVWSGPYDYPMAANGFELQVGAQLGLGGYSAGGATLVADYSHLFARSASGGVGFWLYANLGFAAPGSGICSDSRGVYSECGPLGFGSDFEAQGGMQLTFRTAVPLVPYARAGLGIGAVFAREGCDDPGVAVPLGAFAGGVRYYVTQHFAFSAGAEFDVGPAFYGTGNHICFGGAHQEVWRTLSFRGGIQIVL